MKALASKLGVVGVLLFSGLPAEAAKPEQIDTTRSDKVRLAYSFSRGQSTSYTLVASQVSEGLLGTDGSITDLKLNVPVTFEVQRMTDGGDAMVAATASPSVVSFTNGGRDIPADPIVSALRSARLSYVVGNDGTVKERSGTAPADTAGAGSGAFVSDALSYLWVQFPQEELAIGATWMQVIPMSLNDERANMSANISVRYTLAGFASVGGREHAVIDVAYNTAIDGRTGGAASASARSLVITGRGEGEGYVLFDHRAGTVTETGLRSGLVITTTENNGFRTMRTFSTEINLSNGSALVAPPAAVVPTTP